MKTRSALSMALAAMAAVALLSAAANALDGKGRLVGFVKDRAGEPVAGAVLILRGEGVVVDARSGKSGVYELDWCSPGTYRLEIRAEGYLSQTRGDVKILRDKDTRLDLVLRRGEHTKGKVVSSEEGVLKLKVGEDTATFAISKGRKVVVLEASQVNPGDEITVTWVIDDGRKLAVDLDGRGTVAGKVTGLGDTWVEVTPDGGKPQRFVPCWVGGDPAQGGGFDKEMLAKLGRLRLGMQVVLTWEMPEGRRVVDVKAVD
ncbi:MAG: hypothetical protein COZ06_29585 [Armatimonadetes bacterium CG_4_10_14_3_um_filter_66_18]|nr:carboxypeptidase regulatory-like domain-containing protein [Armatimonadota bacterium]PIU92816.1 MAG: hypothetical protein COS65_15970 [Armatimonadetes bacterium CG06_land_8_20_14_3_00_66_21]PIX46354.1 MAG: hypothetical protein COZ57_12455 [Armatimonadetes bacterium CG_4_8_14_3_um_filter_66_20]PIY39439.1 MAG: hypothetical protein COZ06_29585 [Armatimonadetes bacterium CG_4_10_14_3_um_filter_66_18]PIZ51318.1 MAG: hypothetical protein COY42_00455 [Armatimonadetes bacterium CG_4_10_14_0_8_um_fil